MSNTKWRTVFSRLAELGIRQIVVKFIGSDDERRIQIPWLQAPRDFVDSVDFGPFPLVAIEWIEVPNTATIPRADNVPAKQEPQDLSAVRSVLESLGKQLPLEATETGLRIIGHIR